MRDRFEYPDAQHILLDVDTVEHYARQAKSPFVGIPIVLDGTRPPAIFLRRIILAAVDAPGHCKALYDTEAKTLLLNGGRNRYLLKDQYSSGTHYMIVEQIRRWAHRRQTSKAAKERNKTAGPMAPKTRQTRELIGKLERRSAKIHCHRPKNPLVPRSDFRPSQWKRDTWREWINQKPLRKALSRFANGGKCKHGRTWNEMYEVLGKVLGQAVGRSARFPRLTHLKHGPDWEQYWKALPHYHSPIRKPRSWDIETDWGSVQDRRIEYCDTLRRKREITGQIEQLKGLLAMYERGLPAVPVEEL